MFEIGQWVELPNQNNKRAQVVGMLYTVEYSDGCKRNVEEQDIIQSTPPSEEDIWLEVTMSIAKWCANHREKHVWELVEYLLSTRGIEPTEEVQEKVKTLMQKAYQFF